MNNDNAKRGGPSKHAGVEKKLEVNGARTCTAVAPAPH